MFVRRVLGFREGEMGEDCWFMILNFIVRYYLKGQFFIEEYNDVVKKI